MKITRTEYFAVLLGFFIGSAVSRLQLFDPIIVLPALCAALVLAVIVIEKREAAKQP